MMLQALQVPTRAQTRNPDCYIKKTRNRNMRERRWVRLDQATPCLSLGQLKRARLAIASGDDVRTIT